MFIKSKKYRRYAHLEGLELYSVVSKGGEPKFHYRLIEKAEEKSPINITPKEILVSPHKRGKTCRHSNIICLSCYKINVCSCGNPDQRFHVTSSYKIPSFEGKNFNRRWRVFLNEHPNFKRRVPERLYPNFNRLLKQIGLKDQLLS